jgi:hypothetical protein
MGGGWFFACARQMQICANLCKFAQSRPFARAKTCKILQKPAKSISKSSINRQPIAGLGLASRPNFGGLRLHLKSSSEMVVPSNYPKGGMREKKYWFDLLGSTLIYLDLLGFGTTCFEEAELGGLSEEREVRYADHPMKGEKKYPTSDGFGWPRVASVGFGLSRMTAHRVRGF